MPNISDTAYPRLKANPSIKELEDIFTPSPEEKQFAWEKTVSSGQAVRLLVWLKVFQRLGYFPPLDEISSHIFEHVAQSIDTVHASEKLFAYNQSTQKWKHHAFVRDYLRVTAYGDGARKAAVTASLDAATTRDDLVDIVNVAIEELIRQRYELPGFSSLVKIARAARTRINSGFHQQTYEKLSDKTKDGLRTLFERVGRHSKSAWDNLKREPKKPTVRHVQEFIKHLQVLLAHDLRAEAFAGIPEIKVNQFAAEARSLDVTSMRNFASNGRGEACPYGQL